MANGVVRRICADESKILRELLLAALLDTPEAFLRSHAEEIGYASDVWEQRARHGAVGSEVATFFALASDGAPTGLITGLNDDDCSGVVEVFSMWVHQTMRGTGLAGDLVDAVAAWAREGAATHLELSVTRGNVAAERFYERIGFVDIAAKKLAAGHPCSSERRMSRRL